MPLRTLGALCVACVAGAPAPALASDDPAPPAAPQSSILASAQRTTAAPVDRHMRVMWHLVDRHVRLAGRAARLRGSRLSQGQRALLRTALERVSSADP